mgnify:CR=1 FL=1
MNGFQPNSVYNWNHRGGDERQFCAQQVERPFVNISRSKFNEFPEYHTSDDALGKTVTNLKQTGSNLSLIHI